LSGKDKGVYREMIAEKEKKRYEEMVRSVTELE
jgi:hypothetical protein